MAQDTSATGNDTTFRSYTPKQAKEYAERRGGYPKRLMEELFALHRRTGGACGCILDLGCGPGNSTRDIAGYFDHAIGLDPGAEMIKTAQLIGGQSKQGPIRFIQGEAEFCDGIADGSVDLITAATSGHWFDMHKFWPTASRILKPHGTVAFLTIWRAFVPPHKTPNSAEIQRLLMELELETLGPYTKHGNRLLMGLYKDLEMPWSLFPKVSSFAQSSYRREIWNPDGVPNADGSYMCGERIMTLEEAEKAIATISAVTRWRETHPALAQTDQDCVKAAFAKIKHLLRSSVEQGKVEDGQEKIIMVGPTVLVTIKSQ